MARPRASILHPRMSPPNRLPLRVRAALQAAGDPARAAAMQAYMKSEMPYWGVPAPRVRALCRELFASYPFADAARWRADVLALWRSATHREERYAALALARHGKARAFQTLEALPMYEEMIVSGAWWDFVDELASHAIGKLLQLYPRLEPRRQPLEAASRHPGAARLPRGDGHQAPVRLHSAFARVPGA